MWKNFKAEPFFLFLEKKKCDLVFSPVLCVGKDGRMLSGGIPSGYWNGATRMCVCVSFQDHETSFPRALSAQRLSPRWCFLDGEFCISCGYHGSWGSWRARHQLIGGTLVFQKIIQKAFLWLHMAGFCVRNNVGLLMLHCLFLKSFPSTQLG